MKYYLSIIIILTLILRASGQSATIIKNKFTEHFSENISVLKSDKKIRNGSYKKYFEKKLVIEGHYTRNQKDSIWAFYNLKGEVEFKYNYSENKLIEWNPLAERESIQWRVGLMRTNPLMSRSGRIFNLKNDQNWEFNTIGNAPEAITVDTPPQYLGGNLQFQLILFDIFQKIERYYSYNSRALISFEIDEEGETSNFRVVIPSGANFETQFIDELKLREMKWSPAIKNNNSIGVGYLLPIATRVEKPDKNFDYTSIIFNDLALFDFCAEKDCKYLHINWDKDFEGLK